MLDFVLQAAKAGDIENAIEAGVTSSTGSITTAVADNPPAIFVVVAGLIALFLVVRLVKRLVGGR